nr:penicillin acylase family protein [Acidobacteriota bacterium]
MNIGKPIRRLLKGVLAVLVVLAVVLPLAGAWLIRRAWPQVDGRLELAGLGAAVSVVRDRFGVPHIFARDEHDLLFAQGYVHAQD